METHSWLGGTLLTLPAGNKMSRWFGKNSKKNSPSKKIELPNKTNGNFRKNIEQAMEAVSLNGRNRKSQQLQYQQQSASLNPGLYNLQSRSACTKPVDIQPAANSNQQNADQSPRFYSLSDSESFDLRDVLPKASSLVYHHSNVCTNAYPDQIDLEQIKSVTEIPTLSTKQLITILRAKQKIIEPGAEKIHLIAQVTQLYEEAKDNADQLTKATPTYCRPANFSRLCLECGEREVDVLFMPCHHMVVCSECNHKSRYQQCLECEKPVTDYHVALLCVGSVPEGPMRERLEDENRKNRA